MYNINVVKMKKSYVLILVFLVFIVVITVIGSNLVTGNIEIKKDNDIFAVQSNREVYFNGYGYDIDNPNVIINPYGNSPLTALVMFETDDYSEVEITIKSKTGNSDINYTFDKDKYHMIPIYGLYADFDNTVVIKSEGKEKILHIKTDKLPDDFMYAEDSARDNFLFYNVNYPYAIDTDGEVRWYLNEHYFGSITLLDNSSIIIGSDRYNEDESSTISFYKMNLLGKIYSEYLLPNGYYGCSAIYNDNILVLSDDILLVDSQTGEVITKYGDNDGYDYLEVVNDSIVVRRDGVFYKIIDGALEEISYDYNSEKYSFYNNTSNYKTFTLVRFGSLNETPVSDEKIVLVNYKKLKELEGISVSIDDSRIEIINNSGDKVYLILDKFMDKKVYDVDEVKYINITGLKGKYTIYVKIKDNIYKTDYYVEV